MTGVIAGFDDKGESRDLVMKGADDNDSGDDFASCLDCPLRFYNPDGVLHFAFYDWLQHGLEDLELKNQGEDDREWDENGEPKRPSYRTAQDQSRDEINWGRWVRQPVADPNKDYPQKDVMGGWDFNKPRWIPEQELEPRAGLGDGITQAALQEKTARQPAPAPLSDASKDAVQGMNPSGDNPVHKQSQA